MKNARILEEFTRGREAFRELMDAGRIEYDISHRGGSVGIDAWRLVAVLFADKSEAVQEKILGEIPRKVGAYCNYLGGGLRGSIVASDISRVAYAYAQERLGGFRSACIDFYNETERENGLQNEEYEDGETNWDNWGTAKCRGAGVVSAY